MGIRRACLALFLSASCFAGSSAGQTKRALLIGINTYQPAGTDAQHPPGCVYGRCELDHFENLEGSVNDAVAMADLLTSPKFGFLPANVVLLTNPAPQQAAAGTTVLPASQTTHDGLLAALKKYLVDAPQPGDTVVVYYAGHGSLRVNSLGDKLTVLVDGKMQHADSTLVPSDIYLGKVHDVRDRELTGLVNAALDRKVHVTLILDSCHSGGATRGVQVKYRKRMLEFDPDDIKEAPTALPAPSQRPDNPALVFSAVQQDQSANETPPPDTGAEPHGAFTAALIEALQVLPADAPASVVYARVKAVLEGTGVPDQDPDLDASEGRRQQPLFGGAVDASGKTRAAVLKMAADGSVWLDVGRASGVGEGSEFASETKDASGATITLRVDKLLGISRSAATLLGPAGAKVKAGDLFDLTKLAPAAQTPLRVWTWPAGLSQADVLAGAAAIRAAGVATVTDPAEEIWTDMLSWDGTNWTLLHAGDATYVPLSVRFKSDQKFSMPCVWTLPRTYSSTWLTVSWTY